MKIHFHEKPWAFQCVLVLFLFAGACAFEAGPTLRAVLFTFSGKDAEGAVTRVKWRRVTHRRAAPFHHFKYTDGDGTSRIGRTRYPRLFVAMREERAEGVGQSGRGQSGRGHVLPFTLLKSDKDKRPRPPLVFHSTFRLHRPQDPAPPAHIIPIL